MIDRNPEFSHKLLSFCLAVLFLFSLSTIKPTEYFTLLRNYNLSGFKIFGRKENESLLSHGLIYGQFISSWNSEKGCTWPHFNNAQNLGIGTTKELRGPYTFPAIKSKCRFLGKLSSSTPNLCLSIMYVFLFAVGIQDLLVLAHYC